MGVMLIQPIQVKLLACLVMFGFRVSSPVNPNTSQRCFSAHFCFRIGRRSWCSAQTAVRQKKTMRSLMSDQGIDAGSGQSKFCSINSLRLLCFECARRVRRTSKTDAKLRFSKFVATLHEMDLERLKEVKCDFRREEHLKCNTRLMHQRYFFVFCLYPLIGSRPVTQTTSVGSHRHPQQRYSSVATF